MRPESDLDIIVEFEPGIRVGLIRFESFAEEPEVLTGRTADLVTRRGLKPWVRPAVLEDARSSMRHEPSFLKDILEACRKIEAIVATTSEDSFLSDEVSTAAVLHHLTVIGQAISRLSVELRERYPDVLWRQIIAVRHRIVHAYLTWIGRSFRMPPSMV